MKYLESVFHCNVCLPLVLYIDARNIKKTALHNINSMKLLICIRVGAAKASKASSDCAQSGFKLIETCNNTDVSPFWSALQKPKQENI